MKRDHSDATVFTGIIVVFLGLKEVSTGKIEGQLEKEGTSEIEEMNV